ncbi:hypothetical protein HA72_1281 [Metallosphaera sedula]|uniref:Uncharacterized protein n=4 Tax=Metallosphaera TaxID=41980 RepID=A4YG88_METS5|nr:hypothetical protein Msed_1281 [Metallosphaera sedula DSM 5348]AIM27425.1 hypothetical protein HA72_1281 [Metallosphaera sedula]BBL47384.1 hypothetical protein MJ1HA_1485 [Metallosphaera sedula]
MMENLIFYRFDIISMAKVYVIHEWDDTQKDQALKFFNGLVDMAKGKKLPKGFKLEKLNVDEANKTAVCEWEVPSMQDLANVASQMGITWKVKMISPVTKYEHKLL